MSTPAWLDPWLSPTDALLLELGCGPGWDTAYLLAQGHQVVAIELQAERACAAKANASAALIVQHDHRQPLPFGDDQFDVVIASLCLHYFRWEVTQAVLREIARCLRPGHRLLFRANSTNDLNHGAVGHPRIDHHFYQVGARTKRFFDSTDVDALFADGWQIEFAEEKTIQRFEKPKVIWEVVARPARQ